MLCTLSKSDQCAPSDERKSLRLSLYSFIILTGSCQYRSWPEKNHTFLCGFLVVCSFVSRHERVAHTEHFHFHKVVAEQVVEDLVLNKVPLKKILSRTRSYWRSIVQDSTILMSDYEENFADFQYNSKLNRPNHWLKQIVHFHWKFHHLLMGRLRVSDMRSSSMTGWILHSWKLENVDQHWRTDLSVTQQCTNDFLTEKL